MNFKYENAVVGGTFDHLHVGHKRLLDTAFESSHKVTIGLTRPVMYHNKVLSGLIQEYDSRKEQVEAYLSEKGYRDRAVLIPIDDIFGNTLQEKHIDAIFVTEENISNVERINAKRKEIGFPEIASILVPYVQDADGQHITSERIRKGDIDRKGFVYQSLFTKNVLTMPEDLRPELQKPIGTVVATTGDVLNLITEKIVITVGDIISEELRQKGIHPAVSVIDFKTRRHELLHELFGKELQAVNSPGTINKNAVDAISTARNNFLQSQEPQTVVVDGEEDLLALPAMLLAPIGSIVLYGQFDQGVVVNIITEELKMTIMRLVQKFA